MNTIAAWIVVMVIATADGSVDILSSKVAFKDNESCMKLLGKVQIIAEKDKTVIAVGAQCTEVPVKVKYD